MTETLEQCRDRWRNRRAMAWWAFRLLCAQTLLAFALAWHDPEAVDALSGILVGSSSAWMVIITAYIGAATWDDVKTGKGQAHGSA